MLSTCNREDSAALCGVRSTSISTDMQRVSACNERANDCFEYEKRAVAQHPQTFLSGYFGEASCSSTQQQHASGIEVEQKRPISGLADGRSLAKAKLRGKQINSSFIDAPHSIRNGLNMKERNKMWKIFAPKTKNIMADARFTGYFITRGAFFVELVQTS